MKGRGSPAAAVLAAAILAAAVVSSIGCSSWRDDTPVTRVEREDFARKVYAEGHLKAVTATPVNSPIDVQEPLKIAWLAPDGSFVRKGEVVVRFDPTEMEKNLEDGKDDQATAEHKITKRGIEREKVLEGLSRDADLARLSLDYARKFQSKDPEIFSRAEIIESDIDEDLAEERKDSAEGSFTIQDELAGADLDLLAIDRKKAELKISEAEQGLRSLEVEAPHDGILVLKRGWRGELPEVGQTVWGGQALAEIPNLEEMEAEVFVLEADAGGLEPGRSASVFLESRPDRVLPATVKKVDALAKPRFRWLPVQYFTVTLNLERTDPEIMKPGQRIRATLILEELEEVLSIPREAVFDEDDKRVVYRKNGWGFDPVEVTLGPSALGRVVVEEGLDEGDLIALQDPTRVSEPETAQPEQGSAVPTATGGMP